MKHVLVIAVLALLAVAYGALPQLIYVDRRRVFQMIVVSSSLHRCPNAVFLCYMYVIVCAIPASSVAVEAEQGTTPVIALIL